MKINYLLLFIPLFLGCDQNRNERANEKALTMGNEKPTPFIDPPLSGLNVLFTTYKVNVEQGAALDITTGSKISIPVNAFVDQNGKPVSGEVELRYREFHDAVDFFVSGIPMAFDSAEEKYQFESAGMMEMLAFQNGKPVKLAAGKSINVELASKFKGDEYNLFKLDTVKNNWSCLGKDKVVIQSASFDNRGSGAANKKTSNQKKSELETIDTKKTQVQKEKELKIAALPKPAVEPKKPEQVKKDKFTFNLDVDAKEFPELALYKGILFEVGPENKNFNRSMYDITWDEAIIKEGPKKGENYSLALKKASKKYDLVVYPVFEGKNYEASLKIYQDKFTKYTAAFEKRKSEEKQIEEAYQAKLLALKKQQEELELSWKEAQNEQFKQMSTEEKVKRTFAINSFGVYNCDNPVAFPKGVMCSAFLTNALNTKLQCYDVYLVDKAKNALFGYTRNPIRNFSFNPASTNILWTVENGILYWLKPEQFKEIQNSDGEGLESFKMNKVDQKFKSTEEMKAFFSL